MSDKKDNIVKKVCKELGITQKELAERMGVNEGTVRNWSSRGEIPEWADKFINLMLENRKYKEIYETLKKLLKLANQ